MQPLLIILLLLSVLTNVLLILLLLRSGQQNTAEDQTDEIARIVRDEVEAETEVLADQLRVMQGEVTRTTSASARDMGTLLAESQRQSQEAATARLDAIDPDQLQPRLLIHLADVIINRISDRASALPTMPCWLSCRCWKPA